MGTRTILAPLQKPVKHGPVPFIDDTKIGKCLRAPQLFPDLRPGKAEPGEPRLFGRPRTSLPIPRRQAGDRATSVPREGSGWREPAPDSLSPLPGVGPILGAAPDPERANQA